MSSDYLQDQLRALMRPTEEFRDAFRLLQSNLLQQHSASLRSAIEDMGGQLQASKILKQVNLVEAVGAPFSEQLRSLQEMRRVIEEQMGGTRAAVTLLQDQTAAFRETMKLLHEQSGSSLAGAVASMRDQSRLLAQLRSDSLRWSEQFSQLRVVLGPQDTIAERIAAIDASMSESSDVQPDTLANQLSDLMQAVLEALNNAKSKLEFRHLVHLAAWLIPLVYSYYLDVQSTAEHEAIRNENKQYVEQTTERLRSMEQLLSDQLDQLSRKIDEHEVLEGDFYVVRRFVWMTEDRRYSGKPVHLLIPEQEVLLLERAGKFVKVEAFDPSTQQGKVGWVLKKYLQRIE